MHPLDSSAKPHLLRALCEWCADSRLTPYLVARVDSLRDRRLRALAADGKICFNIGADATRNLVINADEVCFTARFQGAVIEVRIPIVDALAIFARENGRGMVFSESSQSAPSAAADASDSGEDSESSSAPDKTPKLRVV